MSNEPLGIVAMLQDRRQRFAKFIAPHDRVAAPRQEATALPAPPPTPPAEPPGPTKVEVELMIINARLRADNARLRQILTLNGKDAGAPPESDTVPEPKVFIRDVMQGFCDAMTAAGERAQGEPWTLDHLRSVRRSRDLAWPRQVCMALVRQVCVRESLPKIGKAFGRDHTTAMHAVRRAPEIIAADPQLAAVHETVLTMFAEAK